MYSCHVMFHFFFQRKGFQYSWPNFVPETICGYGDTLGRFYQLLGLSLQGPLKQGLMKLGKERVLFQLANIFFLKLFVATVTFTVDFTNF